MRNLRAVAATLKPLFENPELGAMAEICEILQGLPDDAARLRVMRWSFARFGGEEFKRIVPAVAPHTGSPPQAGSPAPSTISQYEPEAAEDDAAIEEVHRNVDVEDIAHQVSELNDLFPRRPEARRRPEAGRGPDAVTRLRQV